MNICMYVHMYICTPYTVCVDCHDWKIRTRDCIYTYTYIYIYVHTYAYIYVYGYVYFYSFCCVRWLSLVENTNSRLYIHTHRHIYVGAYIGTYVCI